MAKLRVDKIAAPIIEDEFTGSVQFDGTSDYLDIASSTDFAFGTDDFTIEVWVYLNSTTVGAIYSNEVADSFFLYLDSGNLVVRNYGTSNLFELTGPSLRTWTHIALSRSGTDLRLFFNGAQQGSTVTNSTNWTQNGAEIGAYNNGTQSLNGYISNLRIIKGKALYTAAFTPPTRELGVTPETVLLACQSSTDATADATERHKITANGNATAADANPGLLRRTNISSTTSENTGSVFFDGDGDYIDVAASSDFAFGNADFTIEFWMHSGVKTADNFYRRIYMTDGPTGNATGNFQIAIHETTGVINLWENSGQLDLDGTTDVANSTWNHIAAVRSGTTLRLYVNGVEESSTTYSTSVTANSGSPRPRIGNYNGSTGQGDYSGYISNLRVCKGHAVYKSNFAVPTRELEVHEGPDDDRTVFLCCYDGENIFADKTGRHIIAAYGDRLSSPTPTATDSPIGITTFQPGLTRDVDPTAGPTFQGGVGYASQNWLTLPKGTTTERFPDFAGVDSTSARGVFIMGRTGPTSQSNVIDYITISTLGNAQDFGDATVQSNYAAPASSSTRGLAAGGDTVNIIQYITISSTGDAKDFGDLTGSYREMGGASNSTRGLFAGGVPGPTNLIEFVTIASMGNSFDFGDLTQARSNPGGLASPTRALFGGGYVSPARRNTIDYVTIATSGNAVDFGDLTLIRETANGGVSSQTRGLWGGGWHPARNTIDYVTIASLGDAIDFGDLTSTTGFPAGVSSKIRGVWGGGATTNRIEYVTIATTGDATDFGDLTQARYGASGVSNGHGGLG